MRSSLNTIEEQFQWIEKKGLGSKPMIEGPRTFTFNEVISRSRKIGGLLHRTKLRSGAAVAVASIDECEVTCIILGCLRAGYPLLILDPGARKLEAQQAMQKAKVQAAILDQEVIDRWGESDGMAPHIWPVAVRKKKLSDRLFRKKQSADAAATYPECLAEIPIQETDSGTDSNSFVFLTTSGTTASPKILKLGLKNLISASRTQTKQLGFNQNTKLLNLLPITHYDGIMSGVTTALLNVSTIIRLGAFSVQQLPDVFDAIYNYRATHMIVAPSILGLMLRLGEDLAEIFRSEDFQFAISTAATLPAKLWSEFEENSGKRVVNVYGLSETGNYIFAGPDDGSHKIGSIGKAVDCRVLIVDESGRPVEQGAIGELLLSSESVIDGYLDQPAPKITIDGVEYFQTGDLGSVDESSIYRLSGRKKNIIIVGGRNVYPDEINDVLLSHRSVEEAVSVGYPDEIWGERVVSCVVAKDAVTPQELLEHASKHLTDYKVPREIHIVSELPKGRSGKVVLADVIALIQQAAVGQASQNDENLEKQVLFLASQSFRVPPAELSLSTTPQNCSGWDSVAHMDFIVGMETKFGIEFPPNEVIRITSLESAVKLLHKKLA